MALCPSGLLLGGVPGIRVEGGVCGAGAPDGPLCEGAAGRRVCQEPTTGGGGACQLGRTGAGQRATEAGHRPYLSGKRVPQDDSQGKLLPSLKLLLVTLKKSPR